MYIEQKIKEGLLDPTSEVCKVVSQILGRESKHDADLAPDADPVNDDFVCLKCDANMKNPNDWHLPCPLPDPIKECPEKLAFMLRDKSHFKGWVAAMKNMDSGEPLGFKELLWKSEPYRWIAAAIEAWKKQENE